MSLDPFKDSRDRTRRQEQQNGLDAAVVVGVSVEKHMVAIREVTSTGERVTEGRPTNAAVLVDDRGDIALPSEGDMVLVARFKGRTPIVVGTYYTQQSQIPGGADGERHIGGSDGVFIDGPFGVVPQTTDDVSDAPDGAIWYREDLAEYRGMEGGTKVSFDTTAV